MPDDSGYYAPVQFQPLWAVLGLVLVVLVIAWYVFVWWYSRRKHRPKAVQTAADSGPSIEELRSRYRALIDEVERSAGEGMTSGRAAHHRLGDLVRSFVSEATGVKARSMTLDDLERADLHEVAAAVETYYPAEFAEIEQGDVGRSAAMARQVVTTWR
ncbi:hypothetical protein GCM10027416_24180 [Okibacterium endophyticum]